MPVYAFDQISALPQPARRLVDAAAWFSAHMRWMRAASFLHWIRQDGELWV